MAICGWGGRCPQLLSYVLYSIKSCCLDIVEVRFNDRTDLMGYRRALSWSLAVGEECPAKAWAAQSCAPNEKPGAVSRPGLSCALEV